MNSIIEPMEGAGIKVTDLADGKEMLDSYHGLYAPLLPAKSSASVRTSTCVG